MLPIASSLQSLGRALPATRTTDLDVARSHLGQVFTDHDLRLDRGRGIDFVHQQASLGGLSISLLAYGSEVEVVAPPLPDFYLFQVTLGGTVAISSRRFEAVLRPGSMFVMNPGLAYRKRWSRSARQLMIKLPRPTLERRLAADLDASSLQRIVFSAGVLEDDAATQPLLRLLGLVCDDLCDPSGLTRAAPVRARLEETLMSSLLATLPHDRSEALARPASPAAPFYVRRAEAYLAQHHARPITTAALAAAAGVGERTLQQGFRRFRQTTPAAFLRDLRLDRARALLLAGREPSVTRTALACGFQHPGRFARLYGERFGEAPSETLRRRAH